MSELKEALINISEEVRTKVIPENIKAGVQIFDVEGTYLGENSNDAFIYPVLTPGIDVDYQKGYNTLGNLITMIPENVTIAGTSMKGMFSDCIYLKEIPLIDTSKIVAMDYAFRNCTSLETIATLNISSVNNIAYAFENCKNLINVTFLGSTTAANLNTQDMFQSCESLIEAPVIDTNKVTNAARMFQNCKSLINVPVYDFSNNYFVADMFSNCPNLSNNSLDNILQTFITAKRVSNKTLKSAGLTSAQATVCQGLSNYEAFIAAGWSTGY